ncbi:hypothetical protein J6590_018054 [Homalodisca vitripennis]|nr:hypothetical protein J6590_018054 [Homalodisca vitripennis]
MAVIRHAGHTLGAALACSGVLQLRKSWPGGDVHAPTSISYKPNFLPPGIGPAIASTFKSSNLSWK